MRKKSNRTLGENKPKQSQSFDFAQDRFFESENGSLPAVSVAGQMPENRGQITEVYPPRAGQKTACPAGTASKLDMHPNSGHWADKCKVDFPWFCCYFIAGSIRELNNGIILAN